MTDVSQEIAHLSTEGVRPELADLDTRSTREVVAAITHEDSQVPAAVAAVGDRIAEAVDLIVDRMSGGGRLVYVGAGTPGRLGVLDAAECVPTFGTEPGQVVALMAGGTGAATDAVEGAEDDRHAAEEELSAIHLEPDDVVVAISASGRTPYALGAVEAARAMGASTIGLSNNVGSRLSDLVDVAIEVDTGPEVIAGSTRMKSGTAQKLVLNTLSTAAMVRLGKTYGNLMVDVQATNAKLVARSLRIVGEATGVDAPTSARALADADGEVKTAVVALLVGVDAVEARQRLRGAAGRVRDAVLGGDPA